MFWATNSPIFRSTFLTVYTAFGKMRRHCCRPVSWLRWYVSSISTMNEMELTFHLNSGTGRQQCRCIVPKAVYIQSRMGEFVARSM